MPNSQRWLKFLIRLYLPLGILAGLGALPSILLPRLLYAHFSQQSDAPGDTYRAYVMQVTTFSSCGSSSSNMVMVERRFGYFKTGEYVPYCFDGPPDHIHLKCTSPQHLIIRCQNCDSDQIGNYAERWGKLTFTYTPNEPVSPN